ncbi:D-2-hydroxyacid dehydrogenase [Limosilactobacillus gastricus]|uniref:D-2-hydroxyacid dehydrogenase n=1 Tax=Limosilactobacillus gastricus TaxID=227942 RepID=UPI0026EF9A87|nr:D-2-hydroxyacid dehydrogenase [Limosilactobacillus gastricus]
MTTILMTSVRDDEMDAINQYAEQHNITIKTTPKLIEDALDLTTDIDGLVIQQRDPVPDHVYPILKEHGLKQLASRTAGYDMVNVPLAHENGLIVTNVPAYSPRSVAEFALMQIFRLLRNTYAFDHRVAQNDFRWAGLQSLEIHSATIGIIGVGRIGGTLAKLLKALDARVLGYDVNPRSDLAGIVEYVSKDELLQQSDVVSLHVDLNPTSVNLLTASDFQLMKNSAGLVNASRGPVVNTSDLIAALEAHTIKAVALDTVEGEGPVFNADLRQKGISDPQIAKLHALENVILTPHVAFFTNIAVQNMVDFALDDVLTILNGGHSSHEIKP